MPDRPTIDRILIGTSVVYAVKGAPDVPNQYGSGHLVPTEITLTYRSSTDTQLGRVHAYVKGRWRRAGQGPVVDEKLPGQHYYGDTTLWPNWLAEEAQIHDPDAQSGPADRTTILSEIDRLIEHCPEHGCCEPELETCHCDALDGFRRIATEAASHA